MMTHRLEPGDDDLFQNMLDLFESVFDDAAAYGSDRPDSDYVTRLLSNPMFVALVAIEDDNVVGALTAYELPKFEQARSELYIYDLGVCRQHRGKGIATALIDATRSIARRCGGWVVFVQADRGDEPAIELYTRLGIREEVLHFDIPVDKT